MTDTALRPYRLANALDLVWRNLPRGATTFGTCERNCGRATGRGSGPCIQCAEDDLKALVGPELATAYINTVKCVRLLEWHMENAPVSHPFFTSYVPDTVGQLLGTGFQRFATSYGISGLGTYMPATNSLHLLAVVADQPRTGQFRNFITAAKEHFDAIHVWADWNPIVGEALSRYGFNIASTEMDGEKLTGWEWFKPKT